MHQQIITPDQIKRSKEIIHGFSNTKKMPCPSWGISAKRCKTGSKLRLIPGTPCSKCYALNGHYHYPNVVEAQEKRLEGITDPDWVGAMAAQILISSTNYFRWFDSGDLQSQKHFTQIRQVASLTPNVKHWMPTMEYRWVTEQPYVHVPNLTVRLSSATIGRMRKTKKLPTSMIMPVSDDQDWLELVQRNQTDHLNRFFCPSSLQDDKCQGCRACWDKNIQTIVYRQH